MDRPVSAVVDPRAGGSTSAAPAAVPPLAARRRPAPAGGAAAGHDDDPADQAAHADLQQQIARAAAAVDSGTLAEPRAVAQIALAAPGRVDLFDQASDAARRLAGSQSSTAPPQTVLRLARSARQVILGEVILTGPDGVRIEQAVPLGADRITRTVLRLTRKGRWECDCRTADELGRHVDLSALAAAPAAVIDPDR